MTRSYGSTVLRPGAGDHRLGAVDRRPLDVLDRDRLALVERVGQPAVDHHPADQPPLLGQAVERRCPRSCAEAAAAAGAPVAASAGACFRFRKSNGTSFLRRAGVLADGLDDGRVGEGRRVAEGPALGDVAQQAAHDLARAGLGQVRHEHQELRPGDRADDVGDVLAQLDGQRVGRLLVGLEDDEREDRLAA